MYAHFALMFKQQNTSFLWGNRYVQPPLSTHSKDLNFFFATIQVPIYRSKQTSKTAVSSFVFQNSCIDP